MRKEDPAVNFENMNAESLEKVFEERLDKILGQVRSVLIKKNRSYGSSSFVDGKYSLIGNYFRQADKINRHRHITFKMIDEGTDAAPFGETIFETLRDEAGYALIGMIICDLMGLAPVDDHEDYTTSVESSEPADEETKTPQSIYTGKGVPPEFINLATELEGLYLAHQADSEMLAIELARILPAVLNDFSGPNYRANFVKYLIRYLPPRLGVNSPEEV
jgi:hypothetical protein